MADSENVWVVKQGDKWAVRREGADRASSLHDTQAAAKDKGRGTAQRDQVELIWQGQDGKIKGRNRYGSDPYPPKG